MKVEQKKRKLGKESGWWVNEPEADDQFLSQSVLEDCRQKQSKVRCLRTRRNSGPMARTGTFHMCGPITFNA